MARAASGGGAVSPARVSALTGKQVASLKEPPESPFVWPFYIGFIVGMGVLHFALGGIGVWLVVMAHQGVRPDPEPVLLGSLVAVLSVLIGVLFCYAPFAPKRPWAWRYHLVLLLLSLPSCVIGAAPLLVLWFRADTKNMFNRS